MAEPQEEFTFRNVQLFKNETLGTGSYGAVCKAMCDQLICAAKLLYPVLFQMQAPDPGKEHRQPFRRFEQECRFLKCINHPNIVQYLGTYHDPETNAPVLLMELMDESLTHFLESSPEDIPYHIQVNLSQDVAQALAFLHANGIIHRDLSSNNVLLIAGSRAKVSDFGMLKFIDASNLATMTQCPGTPAFMSPEALNEPPVYTEKLDTFSLGVLLVQMMTRQYPKPNDRFRSLQIPDPQNAATHLQVLVPIPEVERRQAHITLIEPTHPLLPIALECLKDRDEDRPSSQQLCQMLVDLKRRNEYEQNRFQERRGQAQTYEQHLQEQIKVKDEQLQAYRSDLSSKENEIRELKAKLVQIEQPPTDDKQIQRLKAKLDQVQQAQPKESIGEAAAMDSTISKLKAKLDQVEQEKQQQIQARDTEIQQLRERVDQAQRAKDTEIQQVRESLNQILTENQQEIQAKDIEIRHLRVILEQEVQERDIELRRLNQQLQSSQEVITTLQETISQLETKVSIRRLSETDIVPQPIKQTNDGMMWTGQPDSLIGIFAGSCTGIENTVYFKPRNRQTIYEYNSNSTTSLWRELPPHPLTDYTIVTVDDMLTTVGGGFENWLGNDKCSNQIYSYKNGNWEKHFPSMSIKRDSPGAVSTSSTLVVAGGSNNGEHISAVEAMNIRLRSWSTVSSLPFSTFQPTMTICGNCIYLHPRYMPYGEDKHQCSVIKCSLRDLVNSKPKSTKWKSICSLPVSCSNLVTLNGHLLAVGGKVNTSDSKENETKEVHEYNHMTDSWEVVSEMIEARHYCLTAVLPGNKLLVAGGATSDQTMEIATFI